MIRDAKLKYVKSVNDLDFYLYRPRPGHWFYEGWDGYSEDTEKHSKRQKMRMLLEWLWGGYRIYYAGRNDRLLGYVLVARGGRRITCSTSGDIVLGPYYTLREMRGQGIMPAILNAALHELGISYESAYCYIKKENVASLNAAKKCGFRIVGQAGMRGRLRKLYLTENEDSRFYILSYKQG